MLADLISSMPEADFQDLVLGALGHVTPIGLTKLEIGEDDAVGLVIIDEVDGFCKPRAGNLAPKEPNAGVERMIDETDKLAHEFDERRRPILVLRDEHVDDEWPYPKHCVRGSGEERLVEKLRWLERTACCTIIPKDCNNGWVGAQLPDGRNQIAEWVNRYRLTKLVVVGICGDICTLDFVTTGLSFRNMSIGDGTLMPTLQTIDVFVPGVTSYEMPRDVVEAEGLPPSAIHPQEITNYMGIYLMANRGAGTIGEIVWLDDSHGTAAQ